MSSYLYKYGVIMLLSVLIERIENNPEPNPFLDRDIVIALGLRDKCPYWLHSSTRLTPVRLTASLDATRRLQRDLVPQTVFTIETNGQGTKVSFSVSGQTACFSHRLETHARLMAILQAISIQKANAPERVQVAAQAMVVR